MNAKDMTITRKGNSFWVEYSRGIVVRTEVDEKNSIINFYLSTGKVSSVDVSEFVKLDTAYNSQFGISLTEDGHFFFVQSWEHGLFCFEVDTGTMIWHCTQKKAYDLVINKNIVICHFYRHCISILDILSGEIKFNYPLRYNSIFIPLNDNRFLIGPKRGKYLILDGKLNEVIKISSASFNPNVLENFIIQEASFSGGNISISGVEYSNEALALAIKSRTVNRLVNNSRFTRQVTVF